MAAPILITSLYRKRAEYQAELEHYERKAAKAREAVAKIDATLELFNAGKWTRYDKAKFRHFPEWFKPRELPRLVVTMLRESNEPLSTGDIQARLLALKGIVLTTADERKHFSRRVTGAINDKRRYGIIVSDRKFVGRHLWRLA